MVYEKGKNRLIFANWVFNNKLLKLINTYKNKNLLIYKVKSTNFNVPIHEIIKTAQ